LKNSIAEKVLSKNGCEVSHLLKGSVLALMGNDPVALAKAAADFNKAKKKGNLLGGVLDGSVLSAEQALALSKLPSRDQLIAQTCGVIAAPLRGLVTVLNANISGFARALDAIRVKKEQEAA
jgi:large subunit ribosomal protein L10